MKLTPAPTHQKSRQRQLLIIAILLIAIIVILIILIQPRGDRSSLPENLTFQMTYEVVNVYPHDPGAFTQGLVYLEGFLYESTGRYGESTLRKVALETGEVLQQVNLSPDYFAEGLTVWKDTLVQLTWREGTGIIYDLANLSLLERFTYPTEGWGLTHDGKKLILSDGTATLYFLDPETFQITDSVQVTAQGEDIMRLNELEFICGEVFANIWQTDSIVRINPVSGQVTGWINLAGILPPEARNEDTDVLNGIAYDSANDRLFITGKRWPNLYEIQLIPVLVEN